MWPSVSRPASPQSAASGCAPMPRLSSTTRSTRSNVGMWLGARWHSPAPHRLRAHIISLTLTSIFVECGRGTPGSRHVVDGKPQQLRAEFEPRLFGSIEVDLEMQALADEDKVDLPALLKEP